MGVGGEGEGVGGGGGGGRHEGLTCFTFATHGKRHTERTRTQEKTGLTGSVVFWKRGRRVVDADARKGMRLCGRKVEREVCVWRRGALRERQRYCLPDVGRSYVFVEVAPGKTCWLERNMDSLSGVHRP